MFCSGAVDALDYSGDLGVGDRICNTCIAENA